MHLAKRSPSRLSGATPDYPQNPSTASAMGLDEASQFECSMAPLPEAPRIKHVSLPPVENESPFPIAVRGSSVCGEAPIAGTLRSGTIQHTQFPVSFDFGNGALKLLAGWKIQQ